MESDPSKAEAEENEEAEVEGKVERVRGLEKGTGYAIWAGDVRGREFVLSRRLLKYVGKRVRIKIEVLGEDSETER